MSYHCYYGYELHCLSFKVHHSYGWKSCTFLFLADFVARIQNPSFPDSRFEELSMPLLDGFVGDDRDELLMRLLHALQRYLSRTEQYRPGIEGLFISTGRRKRRVSRNTISFWLRSVISMAHTSVSEEDCCSLRIRAHEVRKVVMSLLFKRNCMVHQVLKAGLWSAQSTSAFCLRDITHRHLDTFSTSPVVAAQQIV